MISYPSFKIENLFGFIKNIKDIYKKEWSEKLRKIREDENKEKKWYNKKPELKYDWENLGLYRIIRGYVFKIAGIIKNCFFIKVIFYCFREMEYKIRILLEHIHHIIMVKRFIYYFRKVHV